jgi:hypothetical protein
MKYKIPIFIFTLACFNLKVTSQINPPALQFANAFPEWTYITKDNNFIKSSGDPWSTPYSGRGILKMDTIQDAVLIFEISNSQNPYLGYDGFLLHKLDIYSGLPMWTYHNNFMSGLKHREYYLSNNYKLHNNNNLLDITGLKAFDEINQSKPDFGSFGKPVRKRINLETGKLMDVAESTVLNSTHYIFWTAYGAFMKFAENNNNKFVLLSRPFIDKDTLKDAIELRQIDSNLNIDTTQVSSIVNNTQIPTQLLSLSARPAYDFINDSTVIALFTIKNPEDIKQSPAKVWLSQIQIKEGSSIGVTKELDIRKYFIFPQENPDPYRMIVKDKNVFVWQHLVPENGSPQLTWLLWLDESLNIKLKVDALNSGNRYYESIEFISVSNESIMVCAYFTDNNIKGYDLLEIKAADGEVIRLGGFHVPLSYPRLLLQKAVLLQDSSLVTGFRTEVPFNGAFTSFCYIMKFSNEILKPTLSNIDIHPKLFFAINISPNPAQDRCVVSLSEDISVGTLIFTDFSGKRVYSARVVSGQNELDISHLPSGVYVCHTESEGGNKYSERKKLVIMR